MAIVNPLYSEEDYSASEKLCWICFEEGSCSCPLVDATCRCTKRHHEECIDRWRRMCKLGHCEVRPLARVNPLVPASHARSGSVAGASQVCLQKYAGDSIRAPAAGTDMPIACCTRLVLVTRYSLTVFFMWSAAMVMLGIWPYNR